jgi:nucleoside-diphosphate-sugar epimerase
MSLERPAPSVPSKVCITGANGFIGKALMQRLRELGAEVTGVDLNPDPGNGIVEGSTTEPDAWASALEGVDTVIHTAAIVSTLAPYDKAWEVNCLGTRKVIDAAINAGVRRFVHFSSVAAFGFEYPDGVTEQYPVHGTGGMSTYHDTKIASEAVALTAHGAGEIDVTVIRPADVYGPGSIWVDGVVLPLTKAGLLPLPSFGEGVWHPVYIDNFVDGIMLVISSDAASGHVFTIGDAAGMPCKEYFGWVAGLGGGELPLLSTEDAIRKTEENSEFLRSQGVENELTESTMRLLNRPGAYSIEKARMLLGYEPVVSWEEGKARTEEALRAAGVID